MILHQEKATAGQADLEAMTKRVATMTRAIAKKTLLPMAKAKGLRDDAVLDLLKRAEIFELTATGELMAPGGVTPEGWVGFVLPKEAPFLFDDHPPTAALAGKRETARERLARANGEPEVSGFE